MWPYMELKRNAYRFCLESLKDRGSLEDLGIDGRITSKCV
jgi:hypothetical protein